MSRSSSQNDEFRTNVAVNTRKRILYPESLIRKSYRLQDNVGKYGTTGQATDDNTAHAHCMLDN
jgi:hypothetical protein